jgi:mono/diheme cytochrome c family protein
MKNTIKNLLLFGAGFFACVMLTFIVPLLVMALGLMDMSASAKPGMLEKIFAPWAFTNSMEKRAPDAKNPFANNPSVLSSGIAHYRENCVMCHGAPNVKPAELAEGLNPPVPRLYTDDAQSLSDGKLFWIIKNGIRMTGMPAFGETHSDEEIWHIVTFVRHLPNITDAERETLKPAASDMEHHHEGMDMNAEIVK